VQSLAARVGLARQLLAAAVLLAASSLGCAAAPSFAVLLLAQVPIFVCSSLTLVERGDPVRRMRRHSLRRLEALLLRGGD
jgi:hypothetical protein